MTLNHFAPRSGKRSASIVLALIMAGTASAEMVGVASAYAGGYLTLNSFSGTPGSVLVVTGGGFTPGDSLSITVAGSITLITTTVAPDSSFSTNVTVPANAVQGPLAIMAVDTANNDKASNSFYVVPLTPHLTDASPSHAPYAVANVSGTGFAPGETIELGLAGATATAVANSVGAFTGTITVPSVPSGLYHLTATGHSSGATSFDYFWIDTFYPSASPSTYYLLPGATLSFTGSGFAASETVTVTQGTSATPLAIFTTDSTGAFAAAGSFAVPASLHGTTASFTLTGAKSNQHAGANVTIGDFYGYASPTSYYLLPGQSETFTGGGFAPNEKINVYIGTASTPVGSFTPDAAGNFTASGSTLVPFNAGTSVTFSLVGEVSNSKAAATVAVGGYYPSLSPSSYYVTPNTSIMIAGAGFASSEVVTLTVAGSASSTVATTTVAGTFNTSVLIPFNGTAGATVNAIGALSGATGSVGVGLAQFYPSVTPSAYFVYPGAPVSYTGTGFVPNESVTIVVGAASSTTMTADSTGTVHTATTTVPFTTFGTLTTRLVGNLSNAAASASIGVGSLSPYLSSDIYSAAPGNIVHVSGASFAPGEIVLVTAGTFSATTTADQTGTTAAVSVPAPFGSSSFTITFTGNSSHAAASLAVSLLSFNASLSASTYYVQPGNAVTITGTGFAPNELVVLSGGIATTTVTATSLGSITSNITLPFSSASSIMVTGTGTSSHASSGLTIALAPFTPQVTPSTYYALPGTTVTFNGTGYAPSESVAIMFNGTAAGSVTTDAAGTFTYSYILPYGSTSASLAFTGVKSHAVTTTPISLASYSAYLSLSNYYGNGGSPVTVSGSGFAPNEPVVLSFNGMAFATTTANALGAIAYPTAIPFSTYGTKPLSAKGLTSGVSAGTTFTVAQIYPGLMLGSYAGAPGSAVPFIGSGYLPNEPISLKTDRTGSTPVATFMTDAAGSFTASSYMLPLTFTEGTLVLTLTGSHSLTPVSITYYVTGGK